MGRRSRKRAPATRAERDAARRSEPARTRRSASERPPALWGSFPLSELVILLGIVVIFWGLFSGGDGGNERVGAGLVLASLGGGELALREHLAGFRSHSSLLAGVAAFVSVTAVAFAAAPVKIWVLLIVGAAVFGGTFYLMRELFKRRSGGVAFR
jgi:hypothetical protein